jgi:transposase
MNAHKRRFCRTAGEQDGSMVRRCALVMDDAGRAELERLSRSGLRAEADRARAVLWSLAGESSAVIGQRLGVRAEQVRRWRGAVARGGVAALRSRPRPGRTPHKRKAALAVAREVLSSPAAEGPLWTLTRLAREIEVRSGETISPGHLSVVLRKGAIAGAGRAIAAKAGRTPARSTVPACGSGS